LIIYEGLLGETNMELTYSYICLPKK